MGTILYKKWLSKRPEMRFRVDFEHATKKNTFAESTNGSDGCTESDGGSKAVRCWNNLS